ncbi:MAG: hypothetical protein ACD_58C00166G0004 [uncultured bacterium]|nr:MAG: hypothetical protein ACD_58C00166G0004 [uncultured bacterium]
MNPENIPQNLDIKSERTENGIWKPSIFKPYSDKIAFGGNTEDFKKTFFANEKNIFLFLRNEARFNDTLSTDDQEKQKIVEIAIKKLLFQLDPNLDPNNIVMPELNHTSNVTVIDQSFLDIKSSEQNLGKRLLINESDGLITNIKGIPLMILGADCPPVMVYDSKNEAIGLFHSGRKGAAGNISVKGIMQMIEKYGTNPNDLKISIGPSISQRNYEIEKDLALKEFGALAYSISKKSPPRPGDDVERVLIDIQEAVKYSLLKIGVPNNQIFISGLDTTENNNLSSFRRNGKLADRMAFILALRESK